MALADVLAKAGIRYADVVIRECERNNVPVACVCVLMVKEANDNIYGHDLNSCMNFPGQRVEVTRENYLEYLACVAAGGKRNGVGPLQLTYWSLQDEADRRGGCYLPEISIQVGVEHFASLLRSSTTATEAAESGKPIEWVAFRRYNGGNAWTERSAAYADHAMTLLPHWQAIVQGVPMLMAGAIHRLDATDTNSKTAMSRWDILCFHTSVTSGPAPAAHFSILGNGTIIQHRDTAKRSSANYEGNHRVISVECMDRGPEFGNWDTNNGHAVPAMTDLQLAAATQIAKWVNETHKIPLQFVLNSRPTTRGVSVHRVGIDGNWSGYEFPGRVADGEKWSTVFGKVCPGDRRIRQVRDVIVPRALNQEDHMLDDERNAVLSTHKAIFFGGGDAGPQSIIARFDELQRNVRALVGRPLTTVLSPEQLAEIKAEIRAAESDADADEVVNRLWQRLTPAPADSGTT